VTVRHVRKKRKGTRAIGRFAEHVLLKNRHSRRKEGGRLKERKTVSRTGFIGKNLQGEENGSVRHKGLLEKTVRSGETLKD